MYANGQTDELNVHFCWATIFDGGCCAWYLSGPNSLTHTHIHFVLGSALRAIFHSFFFSFFSFLAEFLVWFGSDRLRVYWCFPPAANCLFSVCNFYFRTHFVTVKWRARFPYCFRTFDEVLFSVRAPFFSPKNSIVYFSFPSSAACSIFLCVHIYFIPCPFTCVCVSAYARAIEFHFQFILP